jgi:hypothetical protein
LSIYRRKLLRRRTFFKRSGPKGSIGGSLERGIRLEKAKLCWLVNWGRPLAKRLVALAMVDDPGQATDYPLARTEATSPQRSLTTDATAWPALAATPGN